MLDTMKLRLNTKVLGVTVRSKELTVTGGPYLEIAKKGFDHQVCLKEEARRSEAETSHSYLPIRDFSVPTDLLVLEKSLESTLDALLKGKTVAAGCMGGTGRTGLYLALLAKIAGEDQPIEYVRKHYRSHAVETKAQEAYVRTFSAQRLRQKMKWKIVRSRLPF